MLHLKPSNEAVSTRAHYMKTFTLLAWLNMLSLTE